MLTQRSVYGPRQSECVCVCVHTFILKVLLDVRQDLSHGYDMNLAKLILIVCGLTI